MDLNPTQEQTNPESVHNGVANSRNTQMLSNAAARGSSQTSPYTSEDEYEKSDCDTLAANLVGFACQSKAHPVAEFDVFWSIRHDQIRVSLDLQRNQVRIVYRNPSKIAIQVDIQSIVHAKCLLNIPMKHMHKRIKLMSESDSNARLLRDHETSVMLVLKRAPRLVISAENPRKRLDKVKDAKANPFMTQQQSSTEHTLNCSNRGGYYPEWNTAERSADRSHEVSVEQNYAIVPRPSELDSFQDTMLQYTDGILLTFSGNELFTRSKLARFLSNHGYFAYGTVSSRNHTNHDKKYPLKRFVCRTLTDYTQYSLAGVFDDLCFRARWKMYALITTGRLAPTAVNDDLLDFLSGLPDDVLIRALDSVQEHLFGSSDKLCEDNAKKMFESAVEWNSNVTSKAAARYARAAVDAEHRHAQMNAHVNSAPEPTHAGGSSTMYIGHVDVTPISRICRGPFVEVSNRMIRQFQKYSDSFIRVSFVGYDAGPLYANPSEQWDLVLERIRRLFAHGIEILGKHYDFVMYGQSQLRSHSAWFLEYGCGLEAERVRMWMGNPHDSVAGKYAARLGLSLSATEPSIVLQDGDYVTLDDIMSSPDDQGARRWEMTDGCGEISPAAARSIADALLLLNNHSDDMPPSAFQIRFKGYKGMLVQSLVEPVKRNKLVVFRKSQQKMEQGPGNRLEICEVSRFRTCFLNRQVIAVLEGLGIQSQIFVDMQRAYTSKLLRMMHEPRDAIRWLRQGGTGAARGYELDLALLLHNGFSLQRDPFLCATLRDIIKYNFHLLRTKSRVPVEKGAMLLGVYDPTGELKSGQVVIQISHPSLLPELPRTADADETDEQVEWTGYLNTGPGSVKKDAQQNGSNQSNLLVLTGFVAVTRNPCVHAGDVRILNAVNPPNENLKMLRNVVVFPQQGMRPHASEMAFGDLDGDMFSVYYDRRLVPLRMAKPMDLLVPKRTSPGNGPAQLKDVQDFFVDFLVSSSIGPISNAHAVKADECGVQSSQCERLAELAARAVDFPKTGEIVRLAEDLRPKKYPDFMEKVDKPMYMSKKAIGIMYRDVIREANEFARQNPGELSAAGGRTPVERGEVEMDPLLIMPEMKRDRALKVQADALCIQWNGEMAALLSQFGVDSESQLFSGAVLQFHRSTLAIDREIAHKAVVSVDLLRKRFQECFEMGLERNHPHEYRMNRMKKASAWYWAAYSLPAPSFKSFAWLVVDELCNVRQYMKNQQARRALGNNM